MKSKEHIIREEIEKRDPSLCTNIGHRLSNNLKCHEKERNHWCTNNHTSKVDDKPYKNCVEKPQNNKQCHYQLDLLKRRLK